MTENRVMIKAVSRLKAECTERVRTYEKLHANDKIRNHIKQEHKLGRKIKVKKSETPSARMT